MLHVPWTAGFPGDEGKLRHKGREGVSLSPKPTLWLERQQEAGWGLESAMVAATWRLPELSLSWEGPRCGAL